MDARWGGWAGEKESNVRRNFTVTKLNKKRKRKGRELWRKPYFKRRETGFPAEGRGIGWKFLTVKGLEENTRGSDNNEKAQRGTKKRF